MGIKKARVIRERSVPKLLQLGKAFKQAMEEPVAACLVRVCVGHGRKCDQSDCPEDRDIAL